MTNKPKHKTNRSIAKDIKTRKAQLKELSLRLLKGVKGGSYFWEGNGGTGRANYHY